MAISLVQSVGGANPPSSPTIAASGAGNLIVVLVWLTQNATVTSVTDNAGNTYVQVPGAFSTSGSHVSDIWYAKNSLAGATSLTITVTGGSTIFQVAEFSGASTTSPLDVAGHLDNQTTSTPNSPSLTISDGGDVLMAVCPNDTTDTNFPNGVGAPWVRMPNTYLSRFYMVYLLAPGSTGTYTANFNTSDGALIYCSSGVAFKQANPPLSLHLFETVSSMDSLVKQFFKASSDSVTPSDAVIKTLRRPLLEPTLSVDDTEGKITARMVSETVTPDDWLDVEKNPAQNVWTDF